MSGIDSLEVIDKILQREQEINGVRVFKEGDDLKNGLIDIDKIYSIVSE